MKCLSKQHCAGCISNTGVILSMLKEKSSGVFVYSVATGIIASELAADIETFFGEKSRYIRNSLASLNIGDLHISPPKSLTISTCSCPH